MTTTRAGTLDFSSVAYDVSAQEIVALALANVGQSWVGSPAGFAWAISNLAGLPFFDLRDFTDGAANNFTNPDHWDEGFAGGSPADKYESPHWWDDNNPSDGWSLAWHEDGRGHWDDAEVAELKAVLRPGDIVRVYDYGNWSEHSEPDCGDVNSHTFIVVSTTGGKVEVVDTWGGATVVKHDWADIVAEMTRHGEFQSAYVSRVRDDALEGDEKSTLKGKGYGDWSGIGWDLKVTAAPTVSVQSNGTAIDLNFSYRIDNAGTLAVAASKTGIYLSTDATITTSDLLLTLDDVAALAVGGFSIETGKITLPGNLAAGTYYVGAVADKPSAISELNESNNVSAAVAVTIGPDLKVTAAPSLSWNAGALDFSYRIDNGGTTNAPASKTGIYLSTDATITTADTLLTADDVAALGAGGLSTETGKITIPGGVAAGTYYIGVIADHTKVIGELNESNNGSPAVQVTIGSDLTVAPAPTFAWEGDALAFSYRIDNLGTTTAPASQTGIYLSTDATITAGDTLLTADDVAALAAGGSSTETGKITLPGGLAAGTYYIGVIADHTKAIGELNEANNSSPAVQVTVGSDLKVDANPTFAWSGGALNFSYRVDSTGTGTAPASRTGIYISTDSTITSADTLVAVDDVASLVAGGFSTKSGTIAFPAGTPAGTYYIGVVADHTNAIGELNEANNASTGKLITIGADLDVAPAPALKIVWAAAGGTFNLTYTIDNLGTTSSAPATRAGIYLSTDSTITAADRLVAVDDIASLLPGATSAEGGNFVLPGDVASGNYYLGVIADYDNALSELNEANNVSSAVRITVFTNGADTIIVPTGLKAWHGLGGNDTIIGSSDRDALYGDGGRDTLKGKGGNDTLIGGAGADILVGGGGADFFQFDSAAHIRKASGSRDIIADWNPAEDYIDLRGIDAKTGSGNDAFTFVAAAGSSFSGAKGELRWLQENNSGTANDKTLVAGDTNGDKVADFILEITGLHTMRAVDFLL